MQFPPIKADRCLMWITLRPDAAAGERYAALRTVLKACRVHPLDTTYAAELVIVEEAALRAQLAALRDVLGPGDQLHLIARQGERLSVQVITGTDAAADVLPQRPAERRPPWSGQ